MLQNPAPYPIGTPGEPWSAVERAAWLARQRRQRSYADDVLRHLPELEGAFEDTPYGTLDYGVDSRYPLHLLRSRDWDDARPIALVTGGVHGYETSGVMGALAFAAQDAVAFAGRVNLLVVPCVSPWGWEHIQRWNADALDPNRNFRADSPAQECRLLMAALQPWAARVAVHIDLHETTDTDESEFRRALAARDGKTFVPGTIPDGFYLCGDTQRPALDFNAAVIAAVGRVTHIAPADAQGQIIGSPVVAPGVIQYDLQALGLCAGITATPLRTTTEVYPDSPRATPELCNRAQQAAARAAIEYMLAQR